MAISVTNLGSNANSSGSTVAIASTAASVPSGSLIVVGVGDEGSTFGGSVSDGGTNTYTAGPQSGLNSATATNGFIKVFYAANCAALASASTITYTKQGSSQGAISAFYATGIATSSPLDSAVTNNATSNANTTVTSGTPSVTGELFVGFAGNNKGGSSVTYTQDTGNGWATPFNSASVTALTIGGGTQVNAGSGTKTFAPTWSGAGNIGQIVLGFKPVASTAFTKTVSVTCTSSVTLSKKAVGRNVAVAVSTSVSFAKSLTKKVAVTCASTLSIKKAVAHFLPAISVSTLVTPTKNVGKLISTALSTTVSHSRITGFTRTISVACTTAVTFKPKAIAKRVAVACTTTPSFKKAVTHGIALTAVTTTSVKKAVTKPLSMAVTTLTSLTAHFTGWVNPRRKVSLSTLFKRNAE